MLPTIRTIGEHAPCGAKLLKAVTQKSAVALSLRKIATTQQTMKRPHTALLMLMAIRLVCAQERLAPGEAFELVHEAGSRERRKQVGGGGTEAERRGFCASLGIPPSERQKRHFWGVRAKG